MDTIINWRNKSVITEHLKYMSGLFYELRRTSRVLEAFKIISAMDISTQAFYHAVMAFYQLMEIATQYLLRNRQVFFFIWQVYFLKCVCVCVCTTIFHDKFDLCTPLVGVLLGSIYFQLTSFLCWPAVWTCKFLSNFSVTTCWNACNLAFEQVYLMLLRLP